MTIQSPSYKDVILEIKDQYTKGSEYGEDYANFEAKIITNTGFMGSANFLSFSAQNYITHEAPAAIAALYANMTAANKISLGMQGQGSQPVPVRIFVPVVLTLATDHLSIGKISLLTEPKTGTVFCKKLTLKKPKDLEEDPEYFEVVKSWVLNDEAEIETISS